MTRCVSYAKPDQGVQVSREKLTVLWKVVRGQQHSNFFTFGGGSERKGKQ